MASENRPDHRVGLCNKGSERRPGCWGEYILPSSSRRWPRLTWRKRWPLPCLDLAVWEVGALNEPGLMALSQGDLPGGEAYYQQAAHLWRELQEPDRLA